MTDFLQAGAGQGGSMMTLIFLGGMFLVLYFFMIRPQIKRQKEEKKFQSQLQKGEQVVTTSGIHGKVKDITDNMVMVETGAGVIRFERSAISREMSANRYPKDDKGASDNKK